MVWDQHTNITFSHFVSLYNWVFREAALKATWKIGCWVASTKMKKGRLCLASQGFCRCVKEMKLGLILDLRRVLHISNRYFGTNLKKGTMPGCAMLRAGFFDTLETTVESIHLHDDPIYNAIIIGA